MTSAEKNLTNQLADLQNCQTNLTKKVSKLERKIANNHQSPITGTKSIKLLTAENQKLTVDLEYYKPYKSRYETALQTQIDKYSTMQLIIIGIKRLLLKIKEIKNGKNRQETKL